MIDNVKIIDTKILSNNWYVLKKITYEYSKNYSKQRSIRQGKWSYNFAVQQRTKNGNSHKSVSPSNICKW